MSLKVLFMGTPQFAVPSLEAVLASSHKIEAVVTQPPRPSGRGRIPAPSPVMERAQKAGIPVFTPQSCKDSDFHRIVRELRVDVGVVVAYGQILPKALLEIPPLGFLNVHASLLPRHRGASPVAWAIMLGDPITGVTVMKMDEGLDTGPILVQDSTPIGEDEDAQELSSRLSQIGARLLVATLDELEKGSVSPREQDPSLATYAPRLRKEDGLVDWREAAPLIARKVRAMVPWPGAYTTFRGSRLTLWKARPLDLQGGGDPGAIVLAREGSLWVATGKGTLEILELQPEAKPRMTARAFIQGRRGLEGEILGK